jgi:hypothetical protein
MIVDPNCNSFITSEYQIYSYEWTAVLICFPSYVQFISRCCLYLHYTRVASNDMDWKEVVVA